MYSKEQREALFPELNLFKGNDIRHFAIYCLEELPEYFFHIPASSTGKYHPSYALGEGGLVRHTRAAMNILRMLDENGIAYAYEHDTISGLTGDSFFDAALLALLVHDGLKSGPADANGNPTSEHTLHEHPLLSANFLITKLNAYLDIMSSRVDFPLYSEQHLAFIVNAAATAVKSHMGKWGASKYSNIILPSPLVGDCLSKLVHTCDYLASRKELVFDFSVIPST